MRKISSAVGRLRHVNPAVLLGPCAALACCVAVRLGPVAIALSNPAVRPVYQDAACAAIRMEYPVNLWVGRVVVREDLCRRMRTKLTFQK